MNQETVDEVSRNIDQLVASLKKLKMEINGFQAQVAFEEMQVVENANLEMLMRAFLQSLEELVAGNDCSAKMGWVASAFSRKHGIVINGAKAGKLVRRLGLRMERRRDGYFAFWKKGDLQK